MNKAITVTCFINWRSTAVLAFFMLSSLLLSGCSFQLRSNFLADNQLDELYLSSSNEFDQLTRVVKSQLKAYGVNVVSAPKESIATLYLGEEVYSTRPISIYSDGETAEYEISYRVQSRLVSSQGEETPIDVQLHRDFLSNTLEALAEQRKVALIRSELRNMAADQILRDIASIEY